MPLKRDRWTEADIDALPPGEHDYFERKSGRLFEDRDRFHDALSKAVSALANSGGGHLILGVADDGTPDGMPPTFGNERARDWLEQKVAYAVDYTLQDFRVHEVQPAANTRVPAGKVVIVVDVGDSALAPHQSRKSRLYYFRQGGRSYPAPHFYLELLRGRLITPRLQ